MKLENKVVGFNFKFKNSLEGLKGKTESISEIIKTSRITFLPRSDVCLDFQ